MLDIVCRVQGPSAAELAAMPALVSTGTTVESTTLDEELALGMVLMEGGSCVQNMFILHLSVQGRLHPTCRYRLRASRAWGLRRRDRPWPTRTARPRQRRLPQRLHRRLQARGVRVVARLAMPRRGRGRGSRGEVLAGEDAASL